MIRVFKFGGASVKNAEAVRNVASIIANHREGASLLVVVSAMGKTTNALEALVNAAYNNKKDEKDTHLKQLKDFHFEISNQLFGENLGDVEADLQETIDFINIMTENNEGAEYNFFYDQIVSQGEILSTKIVSHYLKSIGLDATYKDARGLIRTDNTYREGKVDWQTTTYLIDKNVKSLLESKNDKVVVTQGFIGKTSEGQTVTLGREGSDYTAAIFAYSLGAKDVTIWKDVPGVLNADPKYFDDAELMSRLSYTDAIELAYYGATVIHPKTIKPLQNKKIPLRVRSFINPTAPGTIILEKETLAAFPSFIFKVSQALISISPKDFSFIIEENLSLIFSLLARYRVKVNLMQHSAINFSICVDNDAMKINPLLAELESNFEVRFQDNLELITIRNYNQALVDRLMTGKELLVEQKNSHTVRLVARNL